MTNSTLAQLWPLLYSSGQIKITGRPATPDDFEPHRATEEQKQKTRDRAKAYYHRVAKLKR